MSNGEVKLSLVCFLMAQVIVKFTSTSQVIIERTHTSGGSTVSKGQSPCFSMLVEHFLCSIMSIDNPFCSVRYSHQVLLDSTLFGIELQAKSTHTGCISNGGQPPFSVMVEDLLSSSTLIDDLV